MNKLLHVLRRLCAPELGEDHTDPTSWDKLPHSWPDHLENAAWNNRILPALQHTPKELLLCMVIDTKRTDPTDSGQQLTQLDVAVHLAYAAQQRLDGYDAMVRHASRVRSYSPKVLVQIYRSDLDYTFRNERKLLISSGPNRTAYGSACATPYRVETLVAGPRSTPTTVSSARRHPARSRPKTAAGFTGGNARDAIPGGPDTTGWKHGCGADEDSREEDTGDGGSEEGQEMEVSRDRRSGSVALVSSLF